MSDNQHNDSTNEVQDENKIIAGRREKLNEIRAKGVAFPNDFRRDSFAGDLQAQYGEMDKETLENQNISVKIAGRMLLKRVMGKASFATVSDMSGKIQLYIQRDKIGEDIYNNFKHWDLGDILGAEGVL
ncbi:MAG: lysine--tRNA ligase, partial [Neisseriaceae bacterium]|nr:lysine--tRNA ligase [Neisseriaceae bacterium]